MTTRNRVSCKFDRASPHKWAFPAEGEVLNRSRTGITLGFTRAVAQVIVGEDFYSWPNWVIEKRLMNMLSRGQGRVEIVIMEPCPLDPHNCRWPYLTKEAHGE